VTNGELVIDKSLKIAGPGATNLAIHSYFRQRLFIKHTQLVEAS
jgi:hypothetical protein